MRRLGPGRGDLEVPRCHEGPPEVAGDHAGPVYQTVSMTDKDHVVSAAVEEPGDMRQPPERELRAKRGRHDPSSRGSPCFEEVAVRQSLRRLVGESRGGRLVAVYDERVHVRTSIPSVPTQRVD